MAPFFFPSCDVHLIQTYFLFYSSTNIENGAYKQHIFKEAQMIEMLLTLFECMK